MNVELSGSVIEALLKFCALLLAPMICGFSLTLRLGGAFYLGERFLLGSTLGLALFTAISFVSSLVFGFHLSVLLAVLALFTGVSVLLIKRYPVWNKISGRRLSRIDGFGLAVFSISVILFTFIMNRLIILQDGAFSTGYLDAWGDLPWHTSLIMSFTSQGELHLRNTIAAGSPLVYPFMSDFFSAILVRFQIPLEYAIEWPAILLNSATTTFLFYLSYRLVKNLQAALLVPLLFVLVGGLGFLWFFHDIYFSSKPIWKVLQHLPQRYTNLPEQKIHWINPTLAHLIPQRSFLFGFPMGLSVILFWWRNFKTKASRDAWAPGIILGLLPFFHMHTFITLAIAGAALILVSICFKSLGRKQLYYWLILGAIALCLVFPQLFYILASKVSLDIIRFHPGWMAESENLLWFWIKNLGLFIPLLLAALILRKRLRLSKTALMFYLPFGLIFLIANLFLFAPFAYDNNKILVYWFLLSLPFVARLLVAFRDSKLWWLNRIAFRFVLLSLVLSGALNLLHEFQNGSSPEFNAEEIKLAEQIRNDIEPNAVFLTAPVPNNPLALTGHTVVLGYPGHVFSHGLDYLPIEKAVDEIYSGSPQAVEVLDSLEVDYIIVGPRERQMYGKNIQWLDSKYSKKFNTENYNIYTVKDSNLSQFIQPGK